MTTAEARTFIADHLKAKYMEFLQDANTLTEKEMLNKYYICYCEKDAPKRRKNTKATLAWFLSNIWHGYWWEQWLTLGVDGYNICDLCLEGFLSEKTYTSYRAVRRGTFVYLSNRVAKEIIFG